MVVTQIQFGAMDTSSLKFVHRPAVRKMVYRRLVEREGIQSCMEHPIVSIRFPVDLRNIAHEEM